MPLTSTFSVISARGFGQYISIGGSYWISIIGDSAVAGQEGFYSVVLDSSENIYAVGNTRGASSNGAFIASYNQQGVIRWQRTLSSATSNTFYPLTIDGVGNIYAAGLSNGIMLVAKYTTSGVLQFQKSINYAGPVTGLGIGSSGNLYFGGYGGVSDNSALVFKINSSITTPIWTYVFNGTQSDSFLGLYLDSSENVYCVGATDTGTDGGTLIKVNSSGTTVWSRVMADNTVNPSTTFTYGTSADSSGNVYAVGRTGGTTLAAFIVKYNSSGTAQWQRFLGGLGGITCSFSKVYVFSNNEIYVLGSSGSPDVSFLLAKYDANGVLQWQRNLGGTGSDTSLTVGNGITLSASGDIYFCGNSTTGGSGGTVDCALVKLPGDGSKTGTYGNWTYSVSTHTDSAGTMALTTWTVPPTTATLPAIATTTLVDSASSYTNNLTTL